MKSLTISFIRDLSQVFAVTEFQSHLFAEYKAF